MHPDALAWFARRTSTAAHWPRADVARAKGTHQVSVVIPAKDEEATVGDVVSAIREDLMAGPWRLVDELLVVDSDSSDATASVAREAGARVVATHEVLPEIPTVTGKGEAMWRGIAATSGDILVFLDADLRSFTPGYVTGLLGPMLLDPGVHLVKAAYERPLVDGSGVRAAGGGRVTELVARPLLNLHWPRLAGVAQPLAGEYAIRRDLIEALPIPCGYGVEFALLVDTAERLGIDAIAQVDLGERLHRHQDEQRLGRMSAEIWQVALDRLDPDQAMRRPVTGTGIAQFMYGRDGLWITEHPVDALVRPPLRDVPAYAD
ncbi:MAG: glucosyl-3-phosphoglycerate synthase [Candidatus Nanopelagicales bacterium]